MFDVARSLKVAKTIEIEPKACYKNAILAMIYHRELQRGRYVEGFAVLTVGAAQLPIEHGWLALPDGRVIDPSLAVLGHTDVVYFPAITLTAKRVAILIRDELPLPRMLLHRTARNRTAYLKARKAAYQAAFGTDYRETLPSPQPAPRRG